MPFTFAHPAAAVPLRGLLGRFGVLSALVIGSLTPDLPHFLPGGFSRGNSHSLLGLFTFCLPAGLICYVVFHAFMKGPLLGLLPEFLRDRLGTHAVSFGSLPRVSWLAVCISLFIGAATHVVWDSFTHAHAPGVAMLPILNTRLFTIGSYPVYFYQLLQHSSTVLGLTLIGIWVWRWVAQAPVRPHPLPVSLTASQQRLAIGCILSMSTLVAVWAGIGAIEHQSGIRALELFARYAAFSGIPAAFVSLSLYCAAWHVLRLRQAKAA